MNPVAEVTREPAPASEAPGASPQTPREPAPAVTSVSGNTIHISGPTKKTVVVPAATLQPAIPVGAATPSSVPSEAPVVTSEAQEQSSEDAAEEPRDNNIAKALLITFGVVATVAVLVPAIGYAMGLI